LHQLIPFDRHQQHHMSSRVAANARRQLQAARNHADGLGGADDGAPTDSCTP